MAELVLNRVICSLQSFLGPISEATQSLIWEFHSLEVVGGQSLLPRELRLVPPSVL